MKKGYYKVVGPTTTQGSYGPNIRPGFVFRGMLGDDGRVRLLAENKSPGPTAGWETPRQVVAISEAEWAAGCEAGMNLVPELDRIEKAVAARRGEEP